MAASFLDRVLHAGPAPLEGVARTLGAAAADVAGAFDPLGLVGHHQPDDPLDARDPEYIERTLPALRALSDVYFRGEVHCLEHIPRTTPVLLVGNHSGGTLIADTFVFAQAFYGYFGAQRRFHQLAHDLVFKLPGVRAVLAPYGTVPASPENMRRALARKAALLVYPGGDHESYRPSWESSEVDFAGRQGFVRLAIETRTPIVPVVAIGGQETALFLGRGRRLASALQLDRLLRLKVLAPQIGPPWGITIMDMPGRLPLPAKITVRVLPKIDLHRRLGKRPDPDDAYRLVTDTMQETLDELAEERTLPIVG